VCGQALKKKMSKKQNNNTTIKVGIIGGAGYTAGELIRILLYHPNAKIAFIHSTSNAGNAVTEVHTDLIGETDLVFTNQLQDSVDVIFLCMGHGRSKVFLAKNKIPETIKIIDLSRDFRLKSDDHSYVYGLPELNKNVIQSSNYIANCGCFATTIQLALLPLAKAQLLNEAVHVHAITGSTGAGQSPSNTSHFSWRNNNISIYKAFNHQHLGEIKQSLKQLQPSFEQAIHFLPVRGDFPRGIYSSAYLTSNLTIEQATELYLDFYKNEPFVHISTKNPNLKQVVNTNKAILYLEKHDDQLLIISMIDNLIKGASGQAVQNMNLMFQLEETTGLRLKAVAF
jgi:N-acetyl-gamma-glutamyl-phosphate reductase